MTKRLVSILACLLSTAPSFAATSVSHNGFTITFTADKTVGQYVDGTYWVIGPVTIATTTPASTVTSGRTINGGMINPGHLMGQSQGLDSNYYSSGFNFLPSLNVLRPGGITLSSANPLTIAANNSLLLTESVTSSSAPRPTFSRMTVLTVVSVAPAANSFRPPIVGTNKTAAYTTANLDFGKLLNLPVPSGWPSLSTVSNKFSWFWIDLDASPLTAQNFHPSGHMQSYGGNMAYESSDALLALNLNYSDAQKLPLLTMLVQWGLDLYYQRTVAKQIWMANGGHNHGRKPVILFAGHVLNASNIIAAASNTFATSANSLPVYTDRYIFQEDGQTWTVAHSDVGRSMSQDNGNARATYSQIHVGVAEWGIEHYHYNSYDDSRWNAAYRDINLGRMIPYALVMRMMGIDHYYGNPLHFRMVDRNYTEYLATYSGANDMVGYWKTAMTTFRETQLTAPLPPTGIGAGSATSSAITVSWNNNSVRETGTIVQYSTGGATYTTATTTGANSTNYQVTGLAPSTTYYFRIGNTNSATGEFSGWATGVSAATLSGGAGTPPPPPSGLGAAATSASAINLIWADGSTSETGFAIERSTSATSGFASIATVGANVITFADSGLTASTTYFYRVCAYNEAGSSAYTAVASATTLAGVAAVPAAPATLAATAVSSNRVNLAWSDNSVNETSFLVERSLSAGSGFTQIATVSSNVTGFADQGLAAGTAYFYRLRAANGVGNSPYSSVASATTASASSAGVPPVVSVAGQWQNFPLPPQSGSFSASFNVVPLSAGTDGVIGFSPAVAGAFTDLAMILRFAGTGTIDARNGSAYAAATAVTYSAGSSYFVQVVANVPAKTYSVTVTPPGGSPVALASSWAFRSEQASASSLANLGLFASSGSFELRNFSFTNAVVKPVTVRNPVLAP